MELPYSTSVSKRNGAPEATSHTSHPDAPSIPQSRQEDPPTCPVPLDSACSFDLDRSKVVLFESVVRREDY